MSDAIVVGSGPNGLACAVELARNGVAVTVLEAEDRIGGGTRTSELTVPGLLHDDCSATHPMAAGSPFLNSLELARHGLEWVKSTFDEKKVPCATHLLIRGLSAGEDLVEFARDNKIDEIIVGVRLRSKVGKLLMGSTAQFVILEANCPVVTVK